MLNSKYLKNRAYGKLTTGRWKPGLRCRFTTRHGLILFYAPKLCRVLSSVVIEEHAVIFLDVYVN